MITVNRYVSTASLKTMPLTGMSHATKPVGGEGRNLKNTQEIGVGVGIYIKADNKENTVCD